MDATLRRKAFAGVGVFLPKWFMEGFAVPHLPLDAKKAGWLFGHLLGVIAWVLHFRQEGPQRHQPRGSPFPDLGQSAARHRFG